MDPPIATSSPPSKVASNETGMEKGWISKRMQNRGALGSLSIVQTEEQHETGSNDRVAVASQGNPSAMDPPLSTAPSPSKVASNETGQEKGWISKRMKNSAALGMLSIVPTEEPAYFNLSDSGSFREGLLHISQGGTTVHSSRSALSNEPSSSTGQWGMMSSPGSCRSTTSAKRANYQEEVRFELNRGDFENMEIIGKGSSGFVRKALRKSTNEILALKVVNVFEEEKRKQMMQEVVMMCDAQHESLIRFHGAFYNEGTIAIALEYMTGGSVSDVVKLSGGVPERIMAYMAEQIVQGIAFMHSRKQVHRDFKPCNLLLDHSGRVKITDFGVSAELDRSIDNCTTFVGTFLYMSPERFGSEPYSFPSDIWSFGLTMIECATGEYPYLKGTSKAYWELMEHIVKSEAPTLPADGDFSPKFRSFVSSCLPKEASARATATKLLHHPFIEEHCSSETPEDKQAAIAEWLGSVRSCFVSGNLPNAPNFQPADVGSNFVSFYLAYFLATRRKSLWSLYDHASVLTIGDEEITGRDAIMEKIMDLQIRMDLLACDWQQAVVWDPQSATLNIEAPCAVHRGVRVGGSSGLVRSVRATGRTMLDVHKEGAEGGGHPREQDVEYMGDSPIDHKLSFSLKADIQNKCYTVLRQTIPNKV